VNPAPQRLQKVVAVVAALTVFCVLYSLGTKTKQQRPATPAPVALVSPEPLPSPGLLPGTPKPK
jgi:hypothetical protein